MLLNDSRPRFFQAGETGRRFNRSDVNLPIALQLGARLLGLRLCISDLCIQSPGINCELSGEPLLALQLRLVHQKILIQQKRIEEFLDFCDGVLDDVTGALEHYWTRLGAAVLGDIKSAVDSAAVQKQVYFRLRFTLPDDVCGKLAPKDPLDRVQKSGLPLAHLSVEDDQRLVQLNRGVLDKSDVFDY